jgi:hypothetical protein
MVSEEDELPVHLKSVHSLLNMAPFRQISQSATPEQVAGDPHLYTAYGVGDRRQSRLEIRCALSAWHSLSYRYLLNVVFNGTHGTELVLVYSMQLVKVAGHHMQPLIRAILEGTCTFIQDYHPQEFTPPPKNAPVIMSIAYTWRQN